MPKYVEVRLVNCKQCNNCFTERTLGAGCATDYLCKLMPIPVEKWGHGFKVIAGYCEWSAEEPQDGEIPDWCPLISDEQRSEMIKENPYKYMENM